VRNLPDSRVEVVFQGKNEEVEQMILLCRQGPFLAEVKNIAVEWIDSSESFSGFVIR
jgi:acylphosphatase